MRINTEITEVTKGAVKQWLLDYAWLGTADEQRREVDCIMQQADVVSIVDGLTERYAGQANDDKQALEAQGFALSSLYECHDGPHLATCPRYRPCNEVYSLATRSDGTSFVCDLASGHINNHEAPEGDGKSRVTWEQDVSV